MVVLVVWMVQFPVIPININMYKFFDEINKVISFQFVCIHIEVSIGGYHNYDWWQCGTQIYYRLLGFINVTVISWKVL